jgi:hypothetical protein
MRRLCKTFYDVNQSEIIICMTFKLVMRKVKNREVNDQAII